MALPQLSVDQMKALPETVAFPIERFLPGERADLLPRVASQNHITAKSTLQTITISSV
jgi:hypothetical protein